LKKFGTAHFEILHTKQAVLNCMRVGWCIFWPIWATL